MVSKRLWFVLSAVLVLAMALAGCAATPAAPATGGEAAPGDRRGSGSWRRAVGSLLVVDVGR